MSQKQNEIVKINDLIADPFKLRVYYDDEKIEALKSSILQEGLQVPLKVWLNKGEQWVIDGNYRLLAIKEIGYVPMPDGIHSDNVPIDLMHESTTLEQALLVAVICNWQREEFYFMDKARSIRRLREHEISPLKICARLGFVLKKVEDKEYPSSMFYNYNSFEEYIPDEVKGLLFHLGGKITRRHSEALVLLKDLPDRQKELATLIVIKGLSGPQAMAWSKKALYPPTDLPPLPLGKYRCIVIDPPWPSDIIVRKERPNQGIQYPRMTLENIEKLPIAEKAHSDGCHIYLWVTHKFLPAGLELFEKWGVKYQCILTWIKSTGMTPFSWMYSTEHVLFGRIGSLELLLLGKRLDFGGDVREHSRKPDSFYELVKEVSPEPRVDMFSREKHEGFESWGLEVDKFNAVLF